jgi:hypothetical protein
MEPPSCGVRARPSGEVDAHPRNEAGTTRKGTAEGIAGASRDLARGELSPGAEVLRTEGFSDSRRYLAAIARQASRTRVQNQRRIINGPTEFCDSSCRAI